MERCGTVKAPSTRRGRERPFPNADQPFSRCIPIGMHGAENASRANGSGCRKIAREKDQNASRPFMFHYQYFAAECLVLAAGLRCRGCILGAYWVHARRHEGAFWVQTGCTWPLRRSVRVHSGCKQGANTVHTRVRKAVWGPYYLRRETPVQRDEKSTGERSVSPVSQSRACRAPLEADSEVPRFKSAQVRHL